MLVAVTELITYLLQHGFTTKCNTYFVWGFIPIIHIHWCLDMSISQWMTTILSSSEDAKRYDSYQNVIFKLRAIYPCILRFYVSQYYILTHISLHWTGFEPETREHTTFSELHHEVKLMLGLLFEWYSEINIMNVA